MGEDSVFPVKFVKMLHNMQIKGSKENGIHCRGIPTPAFSRLGMTGFLIDQRAIKEPILDEIYLSQVQGTVVCPDGRVRPSPT